jgi:PAS domain S-box-containing protein
MDARRRFEPRQPGQRQPDETATLKTQIDSDTTPERATAELGGEFEYTWSRGADGVLRVEWVNEALARASGLAIGMNGDELLERLSHPDDRERVREWLRNVLAGHTKPCQHRFLGERKLIHWVSHLARVTAREDGSLRVDCELHDITEAVLAEEGLLESESRFRAMAEHASDIIMELDHEKRMVFVNRAVTVALGWNVEELQGLTVMDITRSGRFLHPDDSRAVYERSVDPANNERPMSNRMRVRHRNGSYRWIEFRSSSFRTARGTVHRVVVGRDVTELLHREEEQAQLAEQLEREVGRRTEALAQANEELRRLQLRLVYAERLGAAEELAARMAHAVNNPLAALLGTIEMEIESSSGHNPRLAQMRRLAQRIRDVLENTLTLVREGNLKLVAEDPGKLLEEVRRELAERAERSGNRIEIEVEEGLPPLSVDRALLGAALVSIAENGLEAMEDDGGGRLLLQVMAEGDMLRFLVKDEGPGIPPEMQKRIFEPFFTTKSSGTGLGLPIAQGIVRGHGGRLTVGNRAEGGALAVVTLPLESGAPALTAPRR